MTVNSCEEESEIDLSLNSLAQDDPILVDMLKNYYITSPPSVDLPYKIDNRNLEPTRLQVSDL